MGNFPTLHHATERRKDHAVNTLRRLAVNHSPCRKVRSQRADLQALQKDKMDDPEILSSKDKSQKTMDLDSHLRGLILSNGTPNADPSAVTQISNSRPMAQLIDQNQFPQAVETTAQRNNSSKTEEQLRSRASSVSRKQPNQGRRRQPEGQVKELELMSPSKLQPDHHSTSHTTQSSSLNLAQPQPLRVFDSQKASYGHIPQAEHGGRVHRPRFEEATMNAGPRQDHYLANRQQIEPYANARHNNRMLNSTSTPHPGNYNPHRPPSFQQLSYANITTRTQNRNAQYPRPIPQNRQLYEPGVYRPSSHNQYRTQSSFQMPSVSARAQALFLEHLAGVEIPKAAISPDELQEKETLRFLIEEICQRSIAEYERKKDSAFDEKSVALKCFGSLASGFATHSADMDLALVSPHSKPESSSPESEIPRLLEKTLLDSGYGVRLLTKTRVPIIKFCEKPTPQLAAKLLEERAKYEKERDAPPKPRKAKNSAEPKQAVVKGNEQPIKAEIAPTGHSQFTQSAEANDRSHSASPPIFINAKAPNMAETKTFEAATAEVVKNHQTPKEISAPILDEVDDAKIDQIKSPANADTASTQIPGASYAHRNEQKLEKSPGTGVAVAVEKEKVTDLSLFSDEELVRLYDLAMKEGWYEPAERATIMTFKKAVEEFGPNSDVADLQAIRSNLQTLTDVLKRYRAPPEHHLDFPKAGVGIQCDINFSNQLALHNTRLLKCYGLCDPRVRPMVLFVKAWAKRRKINSPYHGTLSSYGYVLMVLHYLVNVAQPSIAPNLQTTRKAMQDNSPENGTLVDGYNVRFWRSEVEIVDLAKRGMLTHNREDTVGSLLRGFFQYYAQPHIGFSWATDVLSIRTEGGLLSKAQKGWTGAKTVISEPTAPGQEQKEVRHRFLFAVEDPFEVDHNIARTVVHNGIVAIRDEFRRAHAIIQSAGLQDGRTAEELFAEAESKENLQYRAFGPLPRKDNISTGKGGKAVDDSRKSVGEVGASTHRNGEGITGLVGKVTEARVIRDIQTPRQMPKVGSAYTKDNPVSKPSKLTNGKPQDHADSGNSGNAQVIPRMQNISLKSSVDGTTTQDKETPVQQQTSKKGRSRNKGGKDKVLLKNGSLPVETVANRAPAQGRGVGAVFKNGKEVIGSFGRVGDAGVISGRPSVDTG